MTENEIKKIISKVISENKSSTYDIYEEFYFRSPKVVRIGGGVMGHMIPTLQEFCVKSIIIVVDKIVYDLGLVDCCINSIKTAGIDVSIFTDIDKEPDYDTVKLIVDLQKNISADFILGIGGGSALDAAKAAAVLVGHNDELEEISKNNHIRKIGLGAVPTTAGTGSEVTDIAVIKDNKTGIKIPLKSHTLIPDVALLDPYLMLKVPNSITASTGIDALTHAIEAYASKNSNLMCKSHAFHAVELIAKYLPIAVADGNNIKARYNMAIAAYKAGLAFSNSGLGLVHAISHQIGAEYNISHGISNAMLLTKVMRFNSLSAKDDYAGLAIAFGVYKDNLSNKELCNAVISEIDELIESIGINLDNKLKHLEDNLSTFNNIAKQALNDICLKGNPRNPSKEQIINILESLNNE